MTVIPGAGILPRDQNSVPALGAASLDDVNNNETSVTLLPLVIDNATNRLLVTAEVTSTSLPTGAATLAEQQTQTTSLQLMDDVIVQDDSPFTPATTKVAMAGFEYDDTATDSVDEGDAGAARMSANRNQYVQIRDAAGNERGLNIDSSGRLAATIASGTITTVTTVTNITNQGMGADNAAFTDGTTRVMVGGYIYDEVAGTALTENDMAAARIDSKRAQIGVIEDATTRGQRATVSSAGGLGSNIIQINGTTIDGGNGATSAGTQRVTISNDSTGQVAANMQVASAAVTNTNPVPVASGKATSASTSTGVTVGSTSTTIIASNSSRRAVMIVNDSDETIYLRYGTGATSGSGIRLNASGGSIREELYTGVITGICASGGKNVTVTEI